MSEFNKDSLCDYFEMLDTVPGDILIEYAMGNYYDAIREQVIENERGD